MKTLVDGNYFVLVNSKKSGPERYVAPDVASGGYPYETFFMNAEKFSTFKEALDYKVHFDKYDILKVASVTADMSPYDGHAEMEDEIKAVREKYSILKNN